jgi:H+/gluconate symporter-like permease
MIGIIIGIIFLVVIAVFVVKKLNSEATDEKTTSPVSEKTKGKRWSSIKDWVVGIVAVVVIGFVFMYFHDRKDTDKVVTTTSPADQSGIQKMEECLPGSYQVIVPGHSKKPVNIGLYRTINFSSEFNSINLEDANGRNINGVNDTKYANNMFFSNPDEHPQLVYFTVKDKY